HLFRIAPMSYSVMEGARYYGIGNEYAGALVGCVFAATLSAPLYQFLWKVVAAVLILIGVLVGHPAFGANFGGMAGFATAAVGFGLVSYQGKLRLLDIAICTIIAGLSLAGILLLDTLHGVESQSHFARALAPGSGWVSIAVRKLSLNLYLVLHSPWSLGLIGSIGSFVLLWKSTPEKIRAAFFTIPEVKSAFYGVAFGAA